MTKFSPNFMTHPVSVRVSRKVGLKFSNFRHFCNYPTKAPCCQRHCQSNPFSPQLSWPWTMQSQKRMCPNLFRPNFFKSIGQIDIYDRASEPSCSVTKVFPSTAAPPNPPPHRFLHVWLPRGGALSSSGGAPSSIKNIITEAGLTTPRCWSSKIEI